MQSPPIVLGNINPGELSVGFVDSLLSCKHAGVFSQIMLRPSGPYLDDARNDIVRRFLALDSSDAEYLLFVDSDMTWTVDDVLRLYQSADEDSVVGGLYLNPYPQGFAGVVYNTTYSHDLGMNILTPTFVEDIERNETSLVPCNAVGTGFMLIPRKILEVMGREYEVPCEYFAEPIINGIHLGEDLAFCLRVYELGFRVFVNQTIRPQHTKRVTF